MQDLIVLPELLFYFKDKEAAPQEAFQSIQLNG